MVLIVDDLLLSLMVTPWTFIMDIIYKHALREMYPLDKINDAIKENRMLYEFGELTAGEYGARQKELMEGLEMAKKAREMDLGARLDIFGMGA